MKHCARKCHCHQMRMWITQRNSPWQWKEGTSCHCWINSVIFEYWLADALQLLDVRIKWKWQQTTHLMSHQDFFLRKITVSGRRPDQTGRSPSPDERAAPCSGTWLVSTMRGNSEWEKGTRGGLHADPWLLVVSHLISLDAPIAGDKNNPTPKGLSKKRI